MYPTVRGRRVLSSEGKLFKQAAWAAIYQQKRPAMPFSCRLALTLRFYPPNTHRRDISNLVKAVEDSLVYAQVMVDDSLVDDLRVLRCAVVEGGRVEAEVVPILKFGALAPVFGTGESTVHDHPPTQEA
jgi:crossover junction endodeoxyribonuclease RusA